MSETNVNPFVERSIEWRAFSMESLHTLVTDMYPLDIAITDTVTTTNKLLLTLRDVNNYGKK